MVKSAELIEAIKLLNEYNINIPLALTLLDENMRLHNQYKEHGGSRCLNTHCDECILQREYSDKTIGCAKHSGSKLENDHNGFEIVSKLLLKLKQYEQ